VQAGGGEADQRVARLDPLAGDDRVERDEADRRAAELPAFDDVADLCDLAARDLDARLLGTGAQADADLPADVGVGVATEDEVEHRERLGADTHEVVDVHRHAVDADRVEAR
jgi:hypothetical protein